MSTLHAGLARKPISPPAGIPLIGYGARVGVNQGVHDDLFVTTLILTFADTRAALITADLIFMHPTLVNQVRREVEARCGIPADAVFILCSHTHSGPITYADETSPQAHHDYLRGLVETLIASAVEANTALQPVTLRAGQSQAAININRRERQPDGAIIIGSNPGGTVDHSVQVVQVVAQSGAGLATVVNYACHPVVMGPLNLLVSADWVGAMRETVEAALGGLCLFIQGTTADVNPRKMRWTADNWDEVEEQGQAVGQAVVRAAEAAQPLDVGAIRAAQRDHWLPLMPSGGSNVRQFFADEPSEEEAHRRIHEIFPWQIAVEQHADGLYSPLPIGALRVGDWGLVALGTEPFAETGLAIKAASPAPVTMVAGYANGCNSYLPIASAYADGGYEVETAPIFYGLPAGFAPDGAEAVAAAAGMLLAGLGGE